MFSKTLFATSLVSTIALANAAVAQDTSQERVFDNQSYVFPNGNNDTPEEETTGVYNLQNWTWYYNSSRNPNPTLPENSCAVGPDPVERYPF